MITVSYWFSLGAGTARSAATLLWDIRHSLVTTVLAGFGRAAAEVGAVMIVGGNIEGVTRVMTTTISLETSKGDLPLALGLGNLGIVIAVNAAAYLVKEAAVRRNGMSVFNGPERPLLPLRLTDVSYEAGGKRLIDGVNLTLESGSRTVILGPNGAGKSILPLCHGLRQPTAGEVHLRRPTRSVAGDDTPWNPAPSDVAPFGSRQRHLRAGTGGRLAQTGGRSRRAPWTVSGSHNCRGGPARCSSGGEQQRLAIARAWAPRPELLLLDELIPIWIRPPSIPSSRQSRPCTRPVPRWRRSLTALARPIASVTR